MRELTDSLRWLEEGTRKHLVAHVALNAQALRNLVIGAGEPPAIPRWL